MGERPKIKPKLTTADTVFEILGWILVFAVWAFTIVKYASLPEIIPIHYNLAGEADRFGGKANILTLPLIATVLFIGMTILNKYPHIFNYPTRINKDNALRQYTIATRMVRYLKFSVVLIFGLLAVETVRNAESQPSELNVWFLPLTLGIIFVPTIYYIMKSI